MRYRKTIIACAAAAAGALVALAGCVPQTQYHKVDGLCRISDGSKCDQSTLLVERRAMGTGGQSDDIYLGFIEFDDQGQLWEPAQVSAVIDLIRQRSQVRPVSIVVFAHGWNHSANASDANVVSFRSMLRGLFDAEAEFANASAASGATREVIGVYIGWRGRSAKGYLTLPTFWARKSTAHRIGNDGAFEVLYRLSAAANGGIQPRRNRLVMVGHSFGGAMLISATAHALTSSLEDLSSGRDRTALQPRGRFADLVVAINPAVEAQRFESLSRRSRELEASLKDEMPLVVAITSVEDRATKFAFPAGRRFGTLFSTYRHGQPAADRTALGHYRPFITHVLSPCEDNDPFAGLDKCKQRSPALQQALIGASYIEAMRQTAGAWRTRRTVPGWQIRFPTAALHHASGPVAGPVMNVQADKSLIADHNDIWNSPVTLFVRDLIAINHFVDRPPGSPE